MNIVGYNEMKPDIDLNLYCCGYGDFKPFRMKPHIRDQYLIHYVVNGECFFEINNKKYVVEKDHIFVIFPGYLVDYYFFDADRTLSISWVFFDGKEAEKLISGAGISLDNPVMKVLPQFDITPIVLSSIKLLQSEIKSFARVKSYLYQMFANLQDSYLQQNFHKTKMKVDTHVLVQKAINHIEYNYMRPITVNQISKDISIHRTYLFKLFKKHLRMSPEEYLIWYRMKKASELLKTTSLLIKEVAGNVGIADIYYFSSLFKRTFGLSPSRYRNQNIK